MGLLCWQGRHYLMYALVSWYMPCQKNEAASRAMVALIPEWAVVGEACNLWIMVERNLSMEGTY